MQTGMKAGLAIVLAVFLTGITGFLTAVVPEDEERTYYDQVSDLTPIVDYSSIESYSEYNPVTNVSGWFEGTGVTIPFLEGEGISAYPYRHYVQSTDMVDLTANTYTGGILKDGWTSAEAAIWYPVSKINEVGMTAGSTAESNGITGSRVSAGHVVIESDERNTDATTFSVYLGHYDENGNLVHGFTYTYVEKTTGSNFKDTSINSLSDFDNTASASFDMIPFNGTSTGIAVTLEVNVTLPADHHLYCAFITAQYFTETAYSGERINLINGKITHIAETSEISPYKTYNGGIDWRSNGAGGPGVQGYTDIENRISLDGGATRVNTDLDPYMDYPIKSLLVTGGEGYDVPDGATLFFDVSEDSRYMRYPLYHGTTSWESDWGTTSNYNQINSVFTATLYPMDNQYLTYRAADRCWYPSILSENGEYYVADTSRTGYASDEIFIVQKGYIGSYSASSSGPVYSYKYVVPKEFVEIGNGAVGKWRNYMDSEVGGETVTSNYYNGRVQLLTEPGTTITSGINWANSGVTWTATDGSKVSGTMSLTVPASIPYSMALVTLDFINGDFYAQGVVWGPIDEEDRNTDNWTVRPYQYPITPTFVRNGTPTSESPTYVEGLAFSKSGGTKAYIVSTDVQTDPMGRLWGDPTIYLGYYFPDYFTYDSTTGNTGVPTTAIRVLINGVVSYGTSLTINGQYMPVADGKITFTYYTYETETIPSDDPNVPPTTNTITVTNEGNMPIKGMAIDWEDGHVYLVFTEQGTTRYDLGEYNTAAADVVIAGANTGKDTVATDIISGTGTWYWQSNLYTIRHEIETVLHLDLTQGLTGWGMTLQTSMLLFAGMLILGVAIVHYYYRDSDEPMGILDWVIIGLALLLCLGVAAI